MIEDSYTSDGFVETFRRLTSDSSVWTVEDYIRISSGTRRDAIEYQLRNLRESQSRVIVLHCSSRLAKVIFEVAEQNFFVERYAWFVTDVVIRNQRLVQSFPVGLVAVNVTQAMLPRELLLGVVRLLGVALKDFDADRKSRKLIDAAAASARERSIELGAGCWIKSQNRSQDGSRLYRQVHLQQPTDK